MGVLPSYHGRAGARLAAAVWLPFVRGWVQVGRAERRWRVNF